MQNITLEFTQNPPVLPTFWKALALPRKGVKQGQSFPHIEATIKNVKVDQDNLNKYIDLCQVNNAEFLPVLYPHVMAGVVHLHIMTHKEFPIKLLGAIHKYNTVNAKRALKPNESFDIRAWIGEQRYYPKGLEFDLHTEVKVGDEVVWSETSTYFKRQRFKVAEQEETPYVSPVGEVNNLSSWHLDKWAGKKYAMICKDFNPIHINKPLAKLFGFKQDLAHGFCTAAQSLSKVDAQELYGRTLKMYFKGPSYLGSTMTLKIGAQDQNRYELYTSGNERPVISFEIL
jgi:acyl dehydratase